MCIFKASEACIVIVWKCQSLSADRLYLKIRSLTQAVKTSCILWCHNKAVAPLMPDLNPDLVSLIVYMQSDYICVLDNW